MWRFPVTKLVPLDERGMPEDRLILRTQELGPARSGSLAEEDRRL
jgi:hypothetical protein